ncbi:MAG: hypothetical protein RBS80_27705 [Thermoguttaceae bacterium]|jgi:hypothetical protein|nr:hypothetical protein [Thermoguttaceae bacterium]
MTRLPVAVSEASDWVNPVAVKEFRQAVQSRWVVAVLMLFLLLNLTVVGGYLLLSPDIHTDAEGGQGVFAFLLSILVFICLGFVPAYAGIRLSLERHSTDIDLFFITTITPGAIVRGKYLTAVALTLLIFSTSMPFMVLTYLLRGIDLPTIFVTLLACFVMCLAANAMGLFAGAVSGGWLIRGLVAAGMVIFLIYMATAVIGAVQMFLFFGHGFLDFGLTTWAGVGTFLAIEAMGIGLLYVFAVALLSARASNRMMPPRLYLTGCWIATGGMAMLWSYVEATMTPIASWVVLIAMACPVLAVAALGERDTWSPRVRRTIPRNRLLRLGALLTYSGSAGGIVWYSLLLVATLLIAGAWNEAFRSFTGKEDLAEVLPNALLGFGYVLCYCLTIAALRPVLFRNVPTGHLSVFAMVLGVAMCLVPYLVAFFAEANWWVRLPWYMLGSPLVLSEMNAQARDTAWQVVGWWLALSALVAVPWMVAQWRRFTPHCPPQAAEAS